MNSVGCGVGVGIGFVGGFLPKSRSTRQRGAFCRLGLILTGSWESLRDDPRFGTAVRRFAFSCRSVIAPGTIQTTRLTRAVFT